MARTVAQLDRDLCVGSAIGLALGGLVGAGVMGHGPLMVLAFFCFWFVVPYPWLAWALIPLIAVPFALWYAVRCTGPCPHCGHTITVLPPGGNCPVCARRVIVAGDTLTCL